MSNIFVLLFLASLLFLIWGVIHPHSLPRKITRKEFSRKRSIAVFGLVALASFILVGIAAPQDSGQVTSSQSAKPATTSAALTSATQPKATISTSTVTETQPIPFETTTQNDSSLPQGQTKTVQTGKNGVSTLTYQVTYENGKETSRKLISQTTTTQAVNQVVANGTYVAPSPLPSVNTPTSTSDSNCTNGTYVNSDGNTVCSPETSSTVPSGATAQCNDGTYSFSQHHSGTCSHHGGVAQWLN